MLAKWFPRVPDRTSLAPVLESFYAGNNAYHAMTAATGKGDDPQVRLLECLVRQGGVYADVGCGCGEVAARVGAVARVLAFDVSPLAIHEAEQRCRGKNVRLTACSADSLPIPDDTCDGSYAFELLEHVWDPTVVARELVRITRPGGFILISAPLWFSLDLHLHKRPVARAAEILLAGVRLALDRIGGRVCRHLEPRLDGEVFPDCDMIAALVPSALARAVERAGCTVDFWDTTYMRAHRSGSATDLKYQRNAAHWFFRHFGDHLLLLAHRNS